jgi:hypothetical protein
MAAMRQEFENYKLESQRRELERELMQRESALEARESSLMELEQELRAQKEESLNSVKTVTQGVVQGLVGLGKSYIGLDLFGDKTKTEESREKQEPRPKVRVQDIKGGFTKSEPKEKKEESEQEHEVDLAGVPEDLDQSFDTIERIMNAAETMSNDERMYLASLLMAAVEEDEEDMEDDEVIAEAEDLEPSEEPEQPETEETQSEIDDESPP